MNQNKESLSEKLIKIGIAIISFGILGLLIARVTLFAIDGESTNEPFIISLLVITTVAIITSIGFFYLWRKKFYISFRNTVTSSSELTSMSEKHQKRGIINYDKSGKIIFMSRWLFSTELSKYLGKRIEKLNLDLHGETTQTITLDKSKFKAIFYNRTRSIIVFDITQEQNLKDFIADNKTSIILVKRTFSSSLDEVSSLKASLKINDIIEEWATTNNAIFKIGQTIDQPILIIGTWKDLKNPIMSESLLKEVSKKEISNITLSIGVAYGSTQYNEIFNNATKANVVAINRGGNQIVILNSKNEYEYVGSSSQGQQTDSKIKIKQFADSLFENIRKHKNVFVTSHISADLDALASSIAIAKLINNKGGVAKIILNDFDETTLPVYKSLPADVKDLFISEEDALKEVTMKTALLTTDISEANRIQAKEVLTKMQDRSVYIIDHHRVGENIINSNIDDRYIDTTASSSAEIITEIIFLSGFDSIVDPSLATLLISGIFLDTNQLSRNASSRTHDAISELIKKGGDTKKVTNTLLASLDEIPVLTKALNNAQIINKNILFSVIPESKIITDSEVSQLANSLLNYKNVKAAIVLAKLKGNIYKVSIRSTNKLNSQLIAEKLGGGGHFNTAAAVFNKSDITYKKAAAKIKKTIQLYNGKK